MKIYYVIHLLIVTALFVCGCSSNSAKSQDNQTKAATQELTVEERLAPSGEMEGIPYVDLGLSSVWALYNYGASNPEEYGNYYAWGETELKPKYSYRNSITYNKDMQQLTGVENNNCISGDPTFDIARKNWGGSWLIPTKEEFDELVDNCEVVFIEYKSVKGWLLTSKVNGKAIFLPAAGYRDSQGLELEKENACYWSGTADDKGITESYGLSIKDNSHSKRFDTKVYGRYLGLPIRPIANWCSEDN